MVKIINKHRGQLKIQQMAFMLMAVFIFFILAGLFYAVIQTQDLRNIAAMKERDRAVTLASVLASSAEFSCGNYCVDADRALVLGAKTEYKDFWSVASIRIRIIDNSTKETICSQGNYPNCNLIKVYDKQTDETSVFSYVSVCRRVKNSDYVYFKCELGQFIVGYETKK